MERRVEAEESLVSVKEAEGHTQQKETHLKKKQTPMSARRCRFIGVGRTSSISRNDFPPMTCE